MPTPTESIEEIGAAPGDLPARLAKALNDHKENGSLGDTSKKHFDSKGKFAHSGSSLLGSNQGLQLVMSALLGQNATPPAAQLPPNAQAKKATFGK